MILGSTEVVFTNHVPNPKFKLGFFSGEVIRFEEGSEGKSEEFWDEHRPLQLNEGEQKFIAVADSIENYLGSDEYFRKIDSAFNKINWYSPLAGVGHRNRAKGREWYVAGLVEQINPVGIGGYRHRLPGHIHQIMSNDTRVELDGFIDYGFRNRDVKGRVGVGWTYNPAKSMRGYVRVGDYYELINTFASIEQLFSRSNYVRTRTVYLSHRMEILNGLFAEIGFDYADQQPLQDIQLANWSNELFG
ncbi:MAG: hypothetical protein HRT74_08025 [Flavobacteriales bacterium]|nr:hypothetical protein [Flavobacteriales bacterium]